MDDAAADEIPGADAGPEEDGVGDEVGGDAAIGHEVEGGEGIVEAAGIGEADEAVLEGLEGGMFGGNSGRGGGDGGGDGGISLAGRVGMVLRIEFGGKGKSATHGGVELRKP